jgi:cephalosporin hydroxylase
MKQNGRVKHGKTAATANDTEAFKLERINNIKKIEKNRKIQSLAMRFMRESIPMRYSYNFDWLGRPIIQYPQDVVAMQEIIWKVKPDLVIETGIARGGSLVFYASMLELIGGRGRVVGVDIDIRKHNKKEIEKHRMSKRITMIEGSSTDEGIVRRVGKIAAGYNRVLVCLDSSHSRDHVLRELKMYSPFVSRGSYLVVFDTIVKDLPKKFFRNRPWGPNNNPASAVAIFLRDNKNFIVDREVGTKLLITVAPGGFLKRIL